MTSDEAQRRYYVLYPEPDEDAAVITEYPTGPESLRSPKASPSDRRFPPVRPFNSRTAIRPGACATFKRTPSPP
jgi:hypothetical protein